MHRILVLLLILLVPLYSEAQVDTLFHVVGKITHSETKEPIHGLVNYYSLPYGAITGLTHGKEFRIPLFDVDRYEFYVECAGFYPERMVIDPVNANLKKEIVWHVNLRPLNGKELVAGSLQRIDNLIFEVGTAKIDPASFTSLDKVAHMLKENPKVIIQLEGHTDPVGSADLNMKLSQERVNAVKSYLVLNGAAKNQIKTKAFGGTHPVSMENTEAAHRLNRRVEMRILETGK